MAHQVLDDAQAVKDFMTLSPVRRLKVMVVGGAGYVGTVTSVGLACLGHHVVAVDMDGERIRALRSGSAPYFEDGLDALLRRCLDGGTLRFTTSLGDVRHVPDIVFITVGTPSRSGGEIDLSQIVAVAEDLVQVINGYTVLVVKSTVPVGTIDLIASVLSRHKVEGRDFDIVVNPEFLREGHGLTDFFYPDRVVLGGTSARARLLVRELYEPIIARRVAWNGTARPGDEPVPVVETDFRSALMTKYAANAFLAVRVSFINEIAGLCERFGADVRDVVRSLGYDPRLGSGYLNPGLGFGGPCLEKDLQALIKVAEQFQYDPKMLRATLERNDRQISELVRKIKQMTGHFLYRRIVAVWGLAFKADTDDVRNSMSLRLIRELESEGAVVQAYDPMAVEGARTAHQGPRYVDDPYAAVDGAEVLVVATEWPEFGALDFDEVKRRMLRPCVVDGRNALDRQRLLDLGFQYVGIGTA